MLKRDNILCVKELKKRNSGGFGNDSEKTRTRKLCSNWSK